MHRVSSSIHQDVERLAQLAMNFRGARVDGDLQAIAHEYARTVQRLIQSGSWREAPSCEDQLPDEWMPQAFYHHWAEEAGG